SVDYKIISADYTRCVRLDKQIPYGSLADNLCSGVNLVPRHQHKRTLMCQRMRQLEVVLIDNGVPHHDQIHVQGTRPPPPAIASPTVGVLDGKRALHQSPRFKGGFRNYHNVEEFRTFWRAPEGLGLVYRGDVHHDHVRRIAEGVDGSLDVAKPISKIRAD